MGDGSKTIHGHPGSTRWRARLGGFLLVTGFLTLGVLLDARNPPLTMRSAGIGAFVSAPFVAAVISELMFVSAPNKTQIEFRFELGRIGRVLTYTLMATLLIFVSYTFIGGMIAGLLVPIASSMGLPIPTDELIYVFSMITGGLFVGAFGPLLLLTVSLKHPTREDHSPSTSKSPQDESIPDAYVVESDATQELRETLEIAEEEFEKGRHKQARLGVEQLESQLADLPDRDAEVRSLKEDITRLQGKILKADAESSLRTAEEAFDDGEIETTKAAVEDLSNTLAKLDAFDEIEIQDLRDAADDLESKLDAYRNGKNADKRLVGMLGSIGAAQSQARALLEDGQDEAAIERIESGLDTCGTATELNATYQLGREERLTEIRAELEQLAAKANSEIEQEALELQDSAQMALERGKFETASDHIAELENLLAEQSSTDSVTVEEFGEEAEALREEIQQQAGEYISEQISAAIEARHEAESHLKADEYEVANEVAKEGLDVCRRGLELQDTFEIDRGDELVEAQSKLESVAGTAKIVHRLTTDAQEQRERVRRAIQAQDYQKAENELADLQTTVDELAEYETAETITISLTSDIEELREEVTAKHKTSRLNGLLGSATSARQRAEELLEEGSREQAIRRLESAQNSLEEAATLNEQYDMGRATSIARKHETVSRLLESVQYDPTEKLTDHLEEAEDYIGIGIDHRDTDNPDAAVEAFQTALQQYESALELAEKHDLPQHWEVIQRHSMVSEYLEIMRDEFDDRQRSVQHDLEQALDAADSATVNVEQHREVDDTISAREALAKAVGYLEDATQLLESGVVSEHQQSRYENLVNQADTLHQELPAEDDTGEYRTRDLVESLQVLASKLGESPRPEFVTAYGDYLAEAYLDEFGSWPEALAAANLAPIDEEARDRRTYSRLDILDAIVDLADELGHPPSKIEMNEHGNMSASPAQARFSNWETALELAEVTADTIGTKDNQSEPDSPDESVTPETSPELSPNELAELYDAFGAAVSRVDALLKVEATVRHGEDSPLANWYEALNERWAGSGFDDAPNYGQQQADRNEFSIAEYREAYGDGETVTNFQEINTESIQEEQREILAEAGIINAEESVFLPTTPTSNARLPILVRTESELSKAMELLEEFPSWPDAEKPPEVIDASRRSETEEESDTGSGETTDRDDLIDQLMEDMDLDPGAEKAHD